MPEAPLESFAPEPWLRVAHILRPHGVRGEVVAELLTDFPDRFERDPTVSLRPPAAPLPTRTAHIERYRVDRDRVVFKFAGCDSIDSMDGADGAEALRGYDVVIPWAARSPLAEDEVYIAELVGCTLIDASSGDLVGPVTGVDRESGATELLVVGTPRGELLVPFIKAYAPRWDLAARILHLQLPAGLLDLHEAPPSEKAQKQAPGRRRAKRR